MSNRQYCLTLNLHDDADLIERYRRYHQPGGVWPEVLASIRASGIQDMRIYQTGTQLMMVLQVNDDFNFETKASLDKSNAKVQEWEALMEQFQKRADHGLGEKWLLAETVFSLSEH